MKEALQGKDYILMFRLLKDATKGAAAKLALQVEHKWNKTRSTESRQTKDGAIVSGGGLETKLDLVAIATKDELNTMLEKSVDDGDVLEVWEIDLNSKDEEGKYNAIYAQGHLESWEAPRNVETQVEISTSMNISGKPQKGQVTLTAEDEEAITYAFRDLVAVPAG